MQGYEFLNRLYKDLYLQDNKSTNGKPVERIERYLSRLERISKKSVEKNRFDLLRKFYFDKYVIKKENVTDKYFELQERIALERGHGEVYYDTYAKKMEIKRIQNDQKSSLNKWIDYFNSSDAMYPLWAKYWAFQGMLKIGTYNSEMQKFNKRTATTVAPFIDLNPELIGLSIDYLTKYITEKQLSDDKVLNKLVENGSFVKIYEFLYTNYKKEKEKNSSNDGVWKKYLQRSDHMPLVKSLENKHTGWCTAAEEMAKTQLAGGDFYVFYTKDKNGEFTDPRIAIRMEGDSIAEVRGIGLNQELEEVMLPTLNDKLKEFPQEVSSLYLRKSSDMNKLNELAKKDPASFTIEDLVFFYECEREIVGFGQEVSYSVLSIVDENNVDSTDPRVDAIFNTRDVGQDIFTLACAGYKTNISDYEVERVLSISLKDVSMINLDCLNEFEIIITDEYLEHNVEIVGSSKEKKLKSFLDFSTLKNPERIKLKNTSVDTFIFDNVEGMEFPNVFNGGIEISSNNYNANWKLPKTLDGGYMSFENIEKANIIDCPILTNGGRVYFSNLLECEEIKLPTSGAGHFLFEKLAKIDKNINIPNNLWVNESSDRFDASINFSSLEDNSKLLFPESDGVCDIEMTLSLSDDNLVKLPSKMNNNLTLICSPKLENLELPTYIKGSVKVNGLKECGNIKLPKIANGTFSFPDLEKLDSDLVVPNDFGSLTDLEENVSKSTLYFEKFTDLGKIKYQDTCNAGLILDSAKNIDELQFPNKMIGDVNLKEVTSIDDVAFAAHHEGDIVVPKVKHISDTFFPEYIKGNIVMENLESADNLLYPIGMDGDIVANNLKYASNLSMPEKLDGKVCDFSSLEKCDNFDYPFIAYSKVKIPNFEDYDSDALNKVCGNSVFFTKDGIKAVNKKYKDKRMPVVVDKYGNRK